MNDDDYSLAPCAGCPRFVLAAELCECDDPFGSMCPHCHNEWHTDDRFIHGGAA